MLTPALNDQLYASTYPPESRNRQESSIYAGGMIEWSLGILVIVSLLRCVVLVGEPRVTQ